MEPVFMVMGQSAATAAVHAISEQTSVQAIDAKRLKAQLLKDGQVLDFESTPISSIVPVTKQKLGGIVMDDPEAERTGFGEVGQSIAPFLGVGYSHDGNAEKGAQKARFTPELPTQGSYHVSILYSAANNRATNVPVLIHSAEGDKTVLVNQKMKLPEGELFRLGTFKFDQGKKGYVEIGNKGTDGHVIVDAVQWVSVP